MTKLMHCAIHRAVGVALLMLAWHAPSRAGDADDYRAQILTSRAAHDQALRNPQGYLSVVGLFFLDDGPNVFGTDASAAIVLPAGSAPPRVGVFDFQDGRVFFRIEHSGLALLNGRTTFGGELRPADPEGQRADQLSIGRLSLGVHQSGPRVAIRVRDPLSPYLKAFSGAAWYAIDERWRVEARFLPHEPPRWLTIPNILGDLQEFESPGIALFDLDGVRYAFEASGTTSDDRIWFIFRDATSGGETYGGGRFLYAEAPKDGRITLDFNRAEQPPCAWNPFTTCPNPPTGNVVAVPVRAGERMVTPQP